MKRLGLLATALHALGCGPGEEPTWALEGTLVEMAVRDNPKHVQGQPPGQQVQVVLAPDRAFRGDEVVPEADWRSRFAAQHRPADGRYVFTRARPPFPEVLPAGGPVRVEVDEHGFLVGVSALDQSTTTTR